MFKVTTIAAEAGGTTLRLEGRLADQWVQELATAAADVMNDTTAVTLNLDGLSYLDASGVALLRALARRGARLAGGSIFVTALIG